MKDYYTKEEIPPNMLNLFEEIALPPTPCLVFDPFLGSGTTAQVAQSLGRNWIGCELNRAYAPMIVERTTKTKEQLREEAWAAKQLATETWENDMIGATP